MVEVRLDDPLSTIQMLSACRSGRNLNLPQSCDYDDDERVAGRVSLKRRLPP